LQNMLPPAPQTVLIAAYSNPHVPDEHVRVWQSVSWPGHSDAVLQPTHVPDPLQNMLSPLPQATFSGASANPHAPAAQVRV